MDYEQIPEVHDPMTVVKEIINAISLERDLPTFLIAKTDQEVYKILSEYVEKGVDWFHFVRNPDDMLNVHNKVFINLCKSLLVYRIFQVWECGRIADLR